MTSCRIALPASATGTEPLLSGAGREGGSLAVLLATHNGAAYLARQLQSIADHRWARVDVWASDDASADATPEILRGWQARWRKGGFHIARGRNAGFAENFRSLVCDSGVYADYVAFCDQDDIWLPEKTSAAVAAIGHAGGAALYCARTILVDADGREWGRSPHFRRPPGFRNALVQNIAGGNTMVLNRRAFDLLRDGARRTRFVSHDWFAYLLVAGAGGQVYYSAEPHVLYRQHDGNIVGPNIGWKARWRRLRQAWQGRFVAWNDSNLEALEACSPLLTDEARTILAQFRRARSGPLPGRLHALRRSGVYRQTAAGQLSLLGACMLGKM